MASVSDAVGLAFHRNALQFQSMPLKTFIEVAPDSHFPLENLPFGIFQPKGGKSRAGVAIGDLIADLSVLEELGHFRSPEFQGRKVFSEDSLNAFLGLGRPAWRKVRAVLQRLLSSKTSILRDNARLRARVFHAQKSVTMKLPARIGNYTDFYSSYHHAHNVGTMLRGPENPALGVPAARPIFGKEFRDEHFARGRDARSARAIPETAPLTTSRAVAVFARKKRFHLRHSARSAAPNVIDGCATRDHAHKFSKSLLEHFPAACASYCQRLQPGTRRFVSQRHHQRRN